MYHKYFNSIFSNVRMIHTGIPSFCSSNRIVLESIFEHYNNNEDPILIECTSNQVNQDGGYTGYNCYQFKEYVFSIAPSKVKNRIILGGDHMGPLPWKTKPVVEAMYNAKKLVSDCVMSGFNKIHIDTSVQLKDDKTFPSKIEVVRRGIDLIAACEESYKSLKNINPYAKHPFYVIGTDVPVPGGSVEVNHAVTSYEDALFTMKLYKYELENRGLNYVLQFIISLVVNTGSEFTNFSVFNYEKNAFVNTKKIIRDYPSIVFEGHSSDYQPNSCIKDMIKDGIRIIKIGPILTYCLRQCLYKLSEIENKLIDEKKRSNFETVLYTRMSENPIHWIDYYNKEDLQCYYRYSYLNRSRYYLEHPSVYKAIHTLFENLTGNNVPKSMVKKMFPEYSYKASFDPYNLVKNEIKKIVIKYNNCTK